jgi:hypothetical protein
VSSLTMDLTFAVESRCRIRGFDRTAMVIAVEAFVSWSSGLDRVAVVADSRVQDGEGEGAYESTRGMTTM